MAFCTGQCMQERKVKDFSQVAGWVKLSAGLPSTNMAKPAGGGSKGDMSVETSYLEGYISRNHSFVEILIKTLYLTKFMFYYTWRTISIWHQLWQKLLWETQEKVPVVQGVYHITHCVPGAIDSVFVFNTETKFTIPFLDTSLQSPHIIKSDSLLLCKSKAEQVWGVNRAWSEQSSNTSNNCIIPASSM